MSSISRTGAAFALWLLAAAVPVSAEQGPVKLGAAGSATCLACHDFGPESPVHGMLESAHGASDSADTPMGRDGCETCHGPSADHAAAPTRVAPSVSYGPRWTASVAAQDAPCLGCHQDDAAKHWPDALHMLNDLTCVTCHDVHQAVDKVTQASTQAEVCTICHKKQKSGIHGLEDFAAMNPSCTTCHNPHDDQTAAATMLDNRSAGCRACHDLVKMAKNPAVSARATSYHKVMAEPDRTCIDCHHSVAHGPTDEISPFVVEAAARRTVALFYPAQSNTHWLLTEHPGAQPLRQGRNCQQCHRGEEANMARALQDGFEPALREVDVAFGRDGGDLLVTLDWEGPADDQSVAVMWGDGGSEAFRRGGCFAACHDDMPGMGRDRGQQTGKYLAVSRTDQGRIGRAPLVKSAGELSALMQAGEFVELWQVALDAGNPVARSAVVLAEPVWNHASKLSASASHSGGRWRVQLRRPLAEGLKTFTAEGKYTLGVALNGAANPGGKHWVSLPLTLSFSGDDTDFRVE
jgi:DmsE family decaheme c-type cytochrome